MPKSPVAAWDPFWRGSSHPKQGLQLPPYASLCLTKRAMLKPTATVFALDNLFFERPDANQKYLEHEEPKNWYLAPAPSVTGIPTTQELQKEWEKNNCLDGKEVKVQSFPDASKTFGMEEQAWTGSEYSTSPCYPCFVE
ncbi:unnamed protein product [Caretta caretta]